MQISITARNFDAGNDIKKYIGKRLQKIQKLYKRIYKCEVILEEEKDRKNVEILVHLKRTKIVAKETSPDIFASIDLAADKVKKQLRRLNDRVSSRRNRKPVFARFLNSGTRMKREKDTMDLDSVERIVKTDTFADKPMLPDEAKMELEGKGMDFIMFKNADTGKSNVLYKRTDGYHGLIEPRG